MTPTRKDVEPTTSATEELRLMLNERGVEYEGGERSLRWRDRNGVMMQAFPLADGELGMEVWSCTPEQAIAATLGSCNCSNNCTNSERTGTCTADETLELGTENAKLRELVRDMWMQLLNAYDRKEVDEFADRMRELGVEVDG